MGDHAVRRETGPKTFMRDLLEDVRVLERMIDEGRIEADVRRVGAEQEFVLVDGAQQPANTALEVLSRLDPRQFTTELGLFSLEANLEPRELSGDCLAGMERELQSIVDQVRAAAAEAGSGIVLCGILPTLEQGHLTLDSMTPHPRYIELNRTTREMRGQQFTTLIKGVDQLQVTQDNVMLEACNTSFRTHFQVSAWEFARLYNLAQLVTAPVLAAAVNAPVLLRRRLWQETRIPLMQQALDSPSEAMTQRGGRQRVSFGDRWVVESPLEIFREDIARFPIMVAADREESSLATLCDGRVPKLEALCLHNGTVYRWNRPCYGITDGRPHLRIENRALPAGPTVVDEMANAAFFYGLIGALAEEYGDVARAMPFDDAKANFHAAARYGLRSRFRWIDGRTWDADELILDHLLPRARHGLALRGVDDADSERLLGIIHERVACGRTGAQWALDSLTNMADHGHVQERMRALTAAMSAGLERRDPVHTWELADLQDESDDLESVRTVGQMMTTDLFTVRPDDLVDLAASLMDWKHIRHVPVESAEGRLVGILSHRTLLRTLADGSGTQPLAIREIMCGDPFTVTPETSSLEAIHLMQRHRVSCLPIVKEGKLVGIVTERDFIEVSSRLLDRWLQSG
ncbi:MAG: CBS domain-containing protein [Planctomycetota bacterium]|nr:MAG: CBS domain-containing protein [Planctomycetota bacterium]